MIKLAIVEPKSQATEKRGVDYYVDRLTSKLKSTKDFEIGFCPFNHFSKFSEFDLIHIPYFEPYSFELPLFSNKPLVVTIHDLTRLIFPDQFPAGPRGKIEWAVQKFFFSRISKVITDSHNSKSDIEKILKIPSNKIAVTHLAADSDFKKTADLKSFKEVREKYHLPEKFILYVGEANWNKNVLSLCKACWQLKIPLVMVGKVWLQSDNYISDNIETMALEMVLNFVKDKRDFFILPGFVPTPDLVNIYNLAQLYVQPSTYEGFGLPLLEAMSCGTPVVSTNVASLPEIAGDAAIYANNTSSEGIAGAIKKFFDLPQDKKKAMSVKSLSQSKKFSWEKTAAETIKVYQAVLNEKP